MTALLKLCDVVTGAKIRPVRIELTCPSNVHPQAYREHLGPNIRFGCAVGTFYFDKSELEAQLSGGTLQRQLQGEGTSYRDVLDETRKSLAEEYLRQRKLSHAQIRLSARILRPKQFLSRLQALDEEKSALVSAWLTGLCPGAWSVLQQYRVRIATKQLKDGAFCTSNSKGLEKLASLRAFGALSPGQ